MRCRSTSADSGTAEEHGAEKDEEAEQADEGPEPRLSADRPLASCIVGSGTDLFHNAQFEHGSCQHGS